MLPLLTAAGVLLLGATLALALRSNPLRAGAAITTQAVAALLVGVGLAPVSLGGAPLTASWALTYPLGVVSLRVDALSAFFLAWSLPMTLLGTIYAVAYLEPSFRAGRNGGPHFALLNVVSLSFLIVYSAQNALIFLLGWELAAVAAWLLVIWDYRSQKVRFAGFNYLVSTHIGLLALVAAFMYLHGLTGSMDFGSFGTFLATPSGARNVVFLLLGASFALKSAFFPVHTWLPRAHAAAPANVSALMSGVIHKAGLFAFLRFLLLFGEPEEWMGWGVLAFGAVSALLGVLYTSSQRDLKRLLGYSSTENVGIAAVGFGLALLGRAWGQPELVAIGLLGGVLHLFNHALFKCLLFYAAGAVYRATHSVDLERLGGLFRRMPWTAVLFGIGALAISGLPPMNGFVSELLLLAGLFGGGAPTPAANAALVCTAALLGFVGAVSALSMVRAFGIVFLGTPRDRAIHVVGDAPWGMRGPMVLHAVGILLVGVLPVLVVQALGPVAALFGVDGAALASVVAILAPVQTGCRVLVVFVWISAAVGFAMGREGRSSVTWGCGYTAGTPRIQYTASSFSATFVDLFATLLPSRRRVQLSTRILPRKTGHFAVSAVDAVERRLFEVLGRGEEMFVRAAAAVPEEPRVAFAGGLALLLALVAALLAGGAK